MPSAVIRAASHDAESQHLVIVFQTGRRDRYFGVPVEVAEGLRRSRSKGEYFNEHIRDRFPFERIQG